MEMRDVINSFPLQGKAPKEIRAILTETLACFLPCRAKDLSASLYIPVHRLVWYARRNDFALLANVFLCALQVIRESQER